MFGSHGVHQDPTQLLQQSVGSLRGGLRQQQGEFIASQAADCVAGAQGAAQQIRHASQQLVAYGVAEGIVHPLEVVQVQIDERHRTPITGGARPLCLQRLVEGPPVGQSGEHVGPRQFLFSLHHQIQLGMGFAQGLFRFPALGDVPAQRGQIGNISAFIPVRRDRLGHRNFASVRTEQRRFSLPHACTDHRRNGLCEYLIHPFRVEIDGSHLAYVGFFFQVEQTPPGPIDPHDFSVERGRANEIGRFFQDG